MPTATKNYVTVEAELGRLAGVEDDVKVSAEDSSYTHPDEVEEFVTRTGVRQPRHRHRHQPRRVQVQAAKPKLRFDILEEVGRRLPGFPIVLHGASSVIPEYVEMINQYGGQMPGAQGVPEDHAAQGRYHGGLQDQHRLATCVWPSPAKSASTSRSIRITSIPVST